jgi:KDO2-lipid IV(A) lauroyltransferase
MSVRHERDIARVRVPFETIAELRASGRGAVVAVAHTGNWDLAACAVARHVPLTVITKRLKVRFLDRLWQGARRARGVKLVEAGGGGAGGAGGVIRAALGRGEFVAMLVDQAPSQTRSVIRVPFLGAPALVDLSPALYALRARVPLVAAFPRRDPDGGHSVEIAAVIHPPAGAAPGRRRWAEEAMAEVTRRLETHVLRHPDQWLWLHRRWKDRGEAAPRVVPVLARGSGEPGPTLHGLPR